MTFEAKDIEMRPRGRPRGLHLCQMAWDDKKNSWTGFNYDSVGLVIKTCPAFARYMRRIHTPQLLSPESDGPPFYMRFCNGVSENFQHHFVVYIYYCIIKAGSRVLLPCKGFHNNRDIIPFKRIWC